MATKYKTKIFLQDVVDNFLQDRKSNESKFLDFISTEKDVLKRFSTITKLLTSISSTSPGDGKNKDCFLFILPYFMNFNDESKSMFENHKIGFHQYAVVNLLEEVCNMLLHYNFLPQSHELRARIINCDSKLFTSFISLNEKEELSTKEKSMEKLILDISTSLFHRKENREFLRNFLNIPVVKNNFDFFGNVSTSSLSDEGCNSSRKDADKI